MLFVVRFVVDAVIGQQHNQRILPGLCAAQFGYEIANTLVEIIESIQNLVVEMLDGHIPRLVTAQRRVANEIRRWEGGGHIIQGAEGDIIAYTPFG